MLHRGDARHPRGISRRAMVSVFGTIRVVCSSSVAEGDAIVHGLIAAAAMLGLGAAIGSGLPAAALAFSAGVTRSQRADAINRGMGVGFLVGSIVGVFFFAAFAAKLVT